MKKYKLSILDNTVLEYKLHAKYQKIGDLKVTGVNVFQIENVNADLITTVNFYYGFIEIQLVQFRYFNDELFVVSGDDVEMKFIDEMKNLLKEYNK